MSRGYASSLSSPSARAGSYEINVIHDTAHIGYADESSVATVKTMAGSFSYGTVASRDRVVAHDSTFPAGAAMLFRWGNLAELV